jgi:hypothetical protein
MTLKERENSWDANFPLEPSTSDIPASGKTRAKLEKLFTYKQCLSLIFLYI